ncbi:amidase family protein [Alkalihalobacterium alkalinitrilicum]|uniref:amidase family protein n=1 Tax=Alkalihalobacterium alkalinitrilicum TaxID=427920 RepID=UPI00099534C2|nr:amidase family protein [Alkalihalobacterium alkalinitrilicum]
MRDWFKKSINIVSSLVLTLILLGVPLEATANAAANKGLANASPVAQSILSVEIKEASISELQREMQRGRLTSEQLVEFYLERIATYDDQLNSFIWINENAIAEARELDKQRRGGKANGALHGIPVILKDNYDTYDMPTTAGALALKDSIPLKDAYQTKRLREEGAIILGKANLHEFAFGFQTISSLGGQSYNPYDLTRFPGGSSGGTAAAVAANLVTVGLGTDTGGSIRIPSSFNSLVGIRPTMGLASRDGIIPLALTQDVGGPMARTVEDAAVVLDVIAGYDPNDPVTEASIGNIPRTYTHYLKKNGLKNAKIGVVPALFGNNAQINKVMEQAIADMEAQGAEVFEVAIPNLNQILAYPSLSGYEFKFQLNDYLESLGPDAPMKSLSDIIDSGLYDPSLRSALITRNNRESLEDDPTYQEIITTRPKLTRESLISVFDEYELDAIVYPTSNALPAVVGGGQGAGNANRLSPYSGFPAISVPAGFSDNGLPIGMEMLGQEFDEPTLIKLAYSYQEATKHRKAPGLY